MFKCAEPIYGLTHKKKGGVDAGWIGACLLFNAPVTRWWLSVNQSPEPNLQLPHERERKKERERERKRERKSRVRIYEHA